MRCALLCSVASLLPAGDSLAIQFGLHAQTRLEVARATSPTGGAYDTNDGTASQPDDVDGYFRRLRLSAAAAMGEHLRFTLILAADNSERGGLGAGRTISPLIASVAWVMRDGEFEHRIHGGLDYPFYNRASFGPQSAQLLPGDRPTLLPLWPRSFGLGWLTSGPGLTAGFDVQQNSNSGFPGYPAATGAPANAGDSAGNGRDGEGLCYTARIEWSPPGWELGPWNESFAGASGRGLGIGIDCGFNDDDRVAYGGAAINAGIDTWCWGVEANLHWDGLSAIAEARWQQTRTSGDPGVTIASSDRVIDTAVYLVQAGYAVVQGDATWELAGRLSRIDIDSANSHESQPFGTADHGQSGWQGDVGVNCYLDRHHHKIQLSYTKWKAESGPADADIVRLQHQLSY
ncbi:hypothetical protein LBMAG53_01240 [Planctomycetota bacterium]|nr:hypothetical protein LBMAG53_01240 [Planctomycetota bacterium]